MYHGIPVDEDGHFSASARPCNFDDSRFESGGDSSRGSSRSDGRSGSTDGRSNRIRRPGRSSLQWVNKDGAVKRRFTRQRTVFGLSRKAVADWMDRVAAFKEKHLVLMHITGRQPTRGPEILSIRHSNTAEVGHRHIFIEDGMVVFVMRYHKGYALQGDVKSIHRYLLRERIEVLVRSRQQGQEGQQQQQSPPSSAHLWAPEPGGKKWTTERMRQRETAAGLGHEITVQAYRDIAIAISRQWIRGPTAFRQDDGEADDGEQLQDEDGAAIADAKKRRRCPFEDEAEEERLDRWIRLNKMNGEERLKQLVGKEAIFRSVQEPALDAIKAGHSPVVAVMPTGAGKSVLFTLPAWAEPGGTTMVVVPLKSLWKDMKRWCDEAGVRCAVWDGRRQPDVESIVLVTPEAAVGEEFRTFLRRIRRTMQLDRIVVDECHVVLNDRVDFRKHLQQLGKLVGVETQMVLLTATMPPAEEGRFNKKMGWMAEEVKLFRRSTARKNVRYGVVGRKGSSRREQKDMVAEFVERELTVSVEGKVVIYCKTRAEVSRLVRAGRFVCEEFRADMSEQRKDEVLEDFRRASSTGA
ncbi:Helicase [Lasiodiplodia theobromae]|uniref:Helicase n=1 Tax=Lasiodiplodia theobromae TaxID=45133 RepID=UPI0015C3215E|nr:Helicase [Lasiodiplodia theobromae]KAF4534197.1 Helicase [Lasiodiplodia theobromae]